MPKSSGSQVDYQKDTEKKVKKDEKKRDKAEKKRVKKDPSIEFAHGPARVFNCTSLHWTAEELKKAKKLAKRFLA